MIPTRSGGFENGAAQPASKRRPTSARVESVRGGRYAGPMRIPLVSARTVVLSVLLGGSLAVARIAADRPVLHERLPAEDGLMAPGSEDPVVVLEDGADPPNMSDPGAVPGSAAGPATGRSEDLLYRTATDPAASAPGTVHSVEHEVRPDAATGREPWLTYHAVFDPAVIPFKRNSAKDRVREDGALVVADATLRPAPVVGNRARPGRELFYGSILVELSAGVPVPMPSVAPQSDILEVETAPEVPLTFFRDGADNFYLDGGSATGRVRVNFVMDAPAIWFRPAIDPALRLDDIPPGQRPQVPARLRPKVAAVLSSLGIRRSQSYREVIQRLVYHFRSFAPGDLPAGMEPTYENLALRRKGVCRHRAYAFVITAQGLGIPARYVANEAHVFAEVWVPGDAGGWTRIDLGGGAQGMNVRNSSQKLRHVPDGPDPFGFPPGFRGGYSQGAQDPAGAAGDPVRGLPPRREPARFGRPGRSPFGLAPGAATGAGGGVPTRLVIEHVSARVFRGDKLRVRGRVEGEDGPVSGGEVRVDLMDRVRKRLIRVLGHVRTDPGGTFDVRLPIPLELDLGTWEVVAIYAGDARRASAVSD